MVQRPLSVTADTCGVLQWAVQARLSATAMFSAMCTAHSDGSRPPLGPQGAGVEGQGAVMRAQVAELSRDNGILKRAVAIQNARLQVNPPNPKASANPAGAGCQAPRPLLVPACRPGPAAP